MDVVVVSDGMLPTPAKGTGGLQAMAHALCSLFISWGHRVTLVGAAGSSLEGGEVVEACEPRWDLSTEEQLLAAAERLNWDVLLDISHYHLTALRHPSNSVILHQDGGPVDPHPRTVFISKAQRARLGAGWVIRNRIPALLPVLAEPDPDLAIFMGNIVPHKGADRAIHLARRAGMRLWICGQILDASFGAKILSMVGDGMTYVGPVAGDEKARVLSRAAVAFCTPCAGLGFYFEPAQIVAVEAASVGTPVLAADFGGLPEYILPDTGRTGANIKELLEKLPECLALPRERVREAARAFLLETAAEAWRLVLEAAATGQPLEADVCV